MTTAAETPVPATESVVGRGRRLLWPGIVIAVLALLGLVVWLAWPAAPGAQVLHTGTDRYMVTVTVHNVRVGTSDIDVAVDDRSGNPVPRAVIRVDAIEPRMGYAAQPIAATPTVPGRYRAAAVPFMMTGPWQLGLSIATPDGTDQLTLPLWIGG
ncbi:FixH family protein [Nocardia terpenica]|uniref:YtkA-like domain-containing protein n=1 Tax=Nocardia terpenica TaxID=455432 RepID=A0A291RE98_9NOCA|nr:FixH family protein [Nocardia terpenica]ATL65667.1 hypothetical protein CRH09_05040 [Nocardia terpenica]